jgi:type I restriction enzyme M protein
VLDKENATARKGVFMIDASKGFSKDGPKNRLREQDIHKIVDTFTRQAEVPRYARMVSVAEIADPKNDYNLNLPRYIDSTEPEDLQDIDSHLRGGIPARDLDALAAYWQILPNVRAALFQPLRPDFYQLSIPNSQLKQAIFGHAEFTAFNESATRLFDQWKQFAGALLKGFDKDGHPKPLIANIAEELLANFQTAPLLDAYDVYQHLMDYWAATMQDDCYLIAADGWQLAAQPRLIVEDKTKKTKARPDFILGKKKYQTELVAPALVIARYFAAEQAVIDQREADVAALAQQLEELAEEHSSEDGLLADALNDKGKLTRLSVSARVKELRMENGELIVEEEEMLKRWLRLEQNEAETNAKLKAAQEALTAAVAAKYPTLTEDEIKALVVDDKWLATIAAAVQGELDRVSQTLTGRIRQLAERYATPLPQLTEEVVALQQTVNHHLERMGFEV